jgi:hypothetical protein
MKSSQITLIVISFILLALMATNPSIEDHRQAVVEKMKEKMTESSNSDTKNEWQKAGEAIGMAIGGGIVEKAVSRDNYLLFSLTKISFGDKAKNIGFGLLGNVFVTNYDDSKNDAGSSVDNKAASNHIIGNLEVYPNDLPEKYNWRESNKRCLEFGDGWRLPTINELKILCENKLIIGGFEEDDYWSSTTSGGNDTNGEGFAEIIHFYSNDCMSNSSAQDGYMIDLLKVRPVRIIN